MSDRNDRDAWAIFCLAACRGIGGRPGAAVTPRLDGESVARALNAGLIPAPGELLLATVERAGPDGPAPAAVLTSRRLWLAAESGGKRPRAIDYRLLPEKIEVADGEPPRLDLGRRLGRSLGGVERPALEAVAGALRAIGRARRSGDLAGEAAPEAIDRARAGLPAVVAQAEAIRRAGGPIRTFAAEVRGATPRVVVTYLLVAACVAVYGAMVLGGVSAFAPRAGDLEEWGASRGVDFAIDGEPWRLLTAVFLHGGLVHLLVNMWVLYRAGPIVERLYGNVGFLLLYLASGVGGSLASATWHPMVTSVGASGAIFGIIGGLGAFLVAHREAIPAPVLKSVRGGVVAFVVYNTLFGMAIPGIDNAAHLGGLTAGLLAGLALQRPWPPAGPTAGLARQLAVAVALAAGLALLSVASGEQIRRELRAGPEAPAVAFLLLWEDMGPLMGDYDRIIAEIGPLDERIAAAPRDPARLGELDALTEIAEQDREDLDSVEVFGDDPDLEKIRDRFGEAFDALIAQLRAARPRLAMPGAPLPVAAGNAPAALQARQEEAVGRFNEALDAYLQKHGLADALAGADRPKTGAPETGAPAGQ